MTDAGKTGLLLVFFIAFGARGGLVWRLPHYLASSPAAQSETARPPELPQRVRVSQSVTQGLIVKKVAPTYPEKARKKRIQGAVLMHVIISKAGDIATLELVSGHPMLAPAAIEAVKQWKYKPYLLNGKPVEVESEIQVNFTLAGN